MRIFIELKCRTILILTNFLFIVNLVYYYKNCLSYLLIKPFILKHNLNFYLIYTNITELFTSLYNIVIFITCLIFLVSAVYNLLMVLKPALYSNEFNYLKFFFIFLIVFVYQALSITIILIPFLYKFFEFFKNNFILNIAHLEIKLNQYFFLYFLFFKINLYFFIFLLIIFSNFQVFKKYQKFLIKIRKTIYLFSLIILCLAINDFFNQLTFILFLFFWYEFILFLCLIKTKIKWDSNP